MTVAPGTRLGPYEIVSPIGAGGMGEVYRAKDTRLDRDVAVKVLPEDFLEGKEPRARFEREAKALAAMNHPNIAAVYSFEEIPGPAPSSSRHLLVTELLEGETLRGRLEHGALPARKVVDLAVQMAEGLAAAHEKGIVHRDLKPENVFVTGEGRVKLLDFGLAKRTDPAAGSVSGLVTAGKYTEPGTVMGTVRYMSPEQVRGEAVDHRSDIFSLGAVLYEMLAGRQAFGRETATESMTAILKEDPPQIASSGSGPSPALQRIVQHCLEKKPGERFQSARDIAFDLQSYSGSAPPSRTTGADGHRVSRLLAVVSVAAVLGVAALVSYRQGEKAERRAAEGITFRQMGFRRQAIFQAVFAPDGETIVYSAAFEGSVPELFTIRPEHPEPRPLGLPRTHLLSISSKGEMAVLTNPRFVAQRLFVGTLGRVSLGASAPREILENVSQADWSPDGAELAIIRMGDGKDRLEFPIGNVLYETGGYMSDLRVSPRGDRIALFEHPARWDDRGSLITVDRKGKRTLLSGDYGGSVEGLAWSRMGDEVLFTASIAGEDRALYGVDLSGHRRVALRSTGALTMHDVSRPARWLVTRDDRRNEISVLAPGETAERDLSWLDYSYSPFLSRDGRLLLFGDASATAGPNYSVCLRKTDGGPVVRLGEGQACGLSPDGKWALAFVFTPPQLVIYPTGPGEARRLPRGDLEAYQSASWFSDGKNVLIVGNEAGKASRCYTQDVSAGLPRPVTPEATTDCSVSPDGHQILYAKPGGTWLIQRGGGGTAQTVPELTPDDRVIRWSADDRAVYVFRSANLPFRFERLDLASGRRVLMREVAPADRTGVFGSSGAALSDDNKTYAYRYVRMTSRLFVVEGAR